MPPPPPSLTSHHQPLRPNPSSHTTKNPIRPPLPPLLTPTPISHPPAFPTNTTLTTITIKTPLGKKKTPPMHEPKNRAGHAEIRRRCYLYKHQDAHPRVSAENFRLPDIREHCSERRKKERKKAYIISPSASANLSRYLQATSSMIGNCSKSSKKKSLLVCWLAQLANSIHSPLKNGGSGMPPTSLGRSAARFCAWVEMLRSNE